jgi:hypothetical protein
MNTIIQEQPTSEVDIVYGVAPAPRYIEEVIDVREPHQEITPFILIIPSSDTATSGDDEEY